MPIARDGEKGQILSLKLIDVSSFDARIKPARDYDSFIDPYLLLTNEGEQDTIFPAENPSSPWCDGLFLWTGTVRVNTAGKSLF
jgi:hypothetical protein